MTRTHDAVVDAQFSPRAEAYVQSAVHSSGADLDALEAIALSEQPDRAIDVGTGGGHAAYRLAPYAKAVAACDLSPGMLAAVAETVRAKGLANIVTHLAAAENLPFEDGHFDLLACRFSAHHWNDLNAGLSEARRVLRPGAPAVFIDVVSPGQPLLDTHLQAIEVLRDGSHVRDYTVAEWIAAIERARFNVEWVKRLKIRIDFAAWIERMGTPEPLAQAVRALQTAAAEPVQAHFAIEPDGTFMIDVMMLMARH